MSAAAQSSAPSDGYTAPVWKPINAGYIRPKYGIAFDEWPMALRTEEDPTTKVQVQIAKFGLDPLDDADDLGRIMTAPRDDNVPFMKYNIHNQMPAGFRLGGSRVDQDAGIAAGAAAIRRYEGQAEDSDLKLVVGDSAAEYMKYSLGRHQQWPGRGGGARDWPDLANGSAWYHYTFFPCIRRFGNQVRGITYVAFYSNFNPWTIGTAQGGLRIPYNTPQWKKYTTQRDSKNDLNIDPVTLNIDDQYVGNDETILAIRAALENTRPLQDSYLCFFPLVHVDTFNGESPYNDGPSKSRAWRMYGASLGAAITALIKGETSVHYTGYLSALFPNEKIMRSGDDAGELYPIPVQINFVEQVDQLHLKIAYCAASPSMPLVVPNKDSLNRRISAEKMKSILTATFVEMAPRFYTISDLDDGRPFMGDSMSTPIVMVATTAESLVLSSYLWLYAQYFQADFLRATVRSTTALTNAVNRANTIRNDALVKRVLATRSDNAQWKTLFAQDATKAAEEYNKQKEQAFQRKVIDVKQQKLRDQAQARMSSLDKQYQAQQRKVANQIGRKTAAAQGKRFMAQPKPKKPSVATRALQAATKKGKTSTLSAQPKTLGLKRTLKSEDFLKRMADAGARAKQKGATKGVFNAPQVTLRNIDWKMMQNLTPAQQKTVIQQMPPQQQQQATVIMQELNEDSAAPATSERQNDDDNMEDFI